MLTKLGVPTYAIPTYAEPAFAITGVEGGGGGGSSSVTIYYLHNVLMAQ